MGLRLILFIIFFVLASVAALCTPFYGILGYIGVYFIAPQHQWWYAPLNFLGLRYSFFFAALTAFSIFIHRNRLNIQFDLSMQEKLFLTFLIVTWFSYFINPETFGRYETSDHPTKKLLKIIIFLLMFTHTVRDIDHLKKLMWIFVFGALILGLEAYEVPWSAYRTGRLENIGGPDFNDANRFGGFMAAMLFIIGANFLMYEHWTKKVLILISGAFTANAVILTRSRGAFLAIGAGMLCSLMVAPKKYKKTIALGLIVASFGLAWLSDPQAEKRAQKISLKQEELDASAKSRLEIWQGGLKMFFDNLLLGVGPGNFYQTIGRYQPLHPKRDAHNTLIRCAGELGLSGLIIFLLIIINAIKILLNCIQQCSQSNLPNMKELLWISYGTLTGLVAMLVYGMTGTLLYTEYLWWMLTIPVCIQRIMQAQNF